MNNLYVHEESPVFDLDAKNQQHCRLKYIYVIDVNKALDWSPR